MKLNNFLQDEGEEEEQKQVHTQSVKKSNKSRPMSSVVSRGLQATSRPQTGMHRPQLSQMSQQTTVFKPSQVCSVKSLLNLKALSRPHLKHGNENPRLENKDIQVLNQLDQEEFKAIEKQIKHINGMDVDLILDLYTAKCQDNKVQYIPAQAVKFIEKFKEMSTETCFSLEDQSLSNYSAKVLNVILLQNKHLLRLQLAKNRLGDVGLGMLCQALKDLPSLVHLDLSSNNIGYVGSQMLFGVLQENSALISLNLSSRDGLYRNRLGDKSVEILEKVLRYNVTLQFLNLQSTNLGFMGVQSILEGLKDNRSLVYLNLSNNQIGPPLGDILESYMKLNGV